MNLVELELYETLADFEVQDWIDNVFSVQYPDVKARIKKGCSGLCHKEDEWHYMKDVNCYEDLHFPPEEEEKGRVLIWKVQVITENGVKLPVCYHCGSYGDLWYEINAYHVIAWKEIVLPELPKEENK